MTTEPAPQRVVQTGAGREVDALGARQHGDLVPGFAGLVDDEAAHHAGAAGYNDVHDAIFVHRLLITVQQR